MNLKDAFRYQTHLQSILNELERFMCNVTVETELHMKSATIPSISDEEIDVSVDRKFAFDSDDIIKTIYAVAYEKIQLNLAIYAAKQDLAKQNVDIDCMTVNNKILQNVQRFVETLANRRTSDRKGVGTAYTLNNEGNQVAYNYPIEHKVRLDYDVHYARQMCKHLIKQTDENSDAIASRILSTEVHFTPHFDCSDDATSIIEQTIGGYYSNFSGEYLYKSESN